VADLEEEEEEEEVPAADVAVEAKEVAVEEGGVERTRVVVVIRTRRGCEGRIARRGGWGRRLRLYVAR
jgi:hypothetical protein